MNIAYYKNDQFFITVKGQFLGWVYIVDWNQDRPIKAIQIPKLETSYLQFLPNEDQLLIGFTNGTF